MCVDVCVDVWGFEKLEGTRRGAHEGTQFGCKSMQITSRDRSTREKQKPGSIDSFDAAREPHPRDACGFLPSRTGPFLSSRKHLPCSMGQMKTPRRVAPKQLQRHTSNCSVSFPINPPHPTTPTHAPHTQTGSFPLRSPSECPLRLPVAPAAAAGSAGSTRRSSL